jgi:glycosyltransferase involved in cell wall biosynthesis
MKNDQLSDYYREALFDGYGKTKVVKIHFKNLKKKVIEFDAEQYPMCHSVSNISKRTIFHNRWSAKQVSNSVVIPHACFDRVEVTDETICTVREKIGGVADGTTVIGMFGFVSFYKRPDKIAEAVKILGENGYDLKLVIWGNLIDDVLLGQYRDEIDWYVTGYLDKDEYEAGFLLTDIVINLRYPTAGESSGTLCEAMKYRKPIIVSDVNQYREFPDEVCWKVLPDNNEVNTLVSYISYLIDNKDVRNTLAENAGVYADNVLSPDRIAKLYYDVLHKEST